MSAWPRVLTGAPRYPTYVRPSSSTESIRLLWLFACAVAWFGFTAWLRPLALPDEGRYVGVAREMLLSGHWLVPTLDGLPFFHKPPLFYWLTAFSMDVFGIHTVAARGASVIAAAVLATGFHAFIRRWQGGATASRCVVVLATMPFFYAGAQFANPDLLVAACIGGAILLAAHAVLSIKAGQPHRGALLAAYALVALGVLAKGLIGVVLPAGVVLAWGLTSGRFRTAASLLAWWPGWLALLAIAAPWFVAVQADYPGFVHYFFTVQHVQRFLSASFNNGQPAWFYPAVLVLLTAPWSPWLVTVIRRDYWRRPDPNSLRTLMLCWLGVVTLFFSLPHSKLVGYILPALPPLAFLVADAWRHAASRSHGIRVGFRTATRVAAGVCVGLAVVAHFMQPKSTAELARLIVDARHVDEPIYFVGNQYFDLPFYADLKSPVAIVDRWSPADLAQDSWRRALVDAASFAPGQRSPLMTPEQFVPALCASAGGWVVAPDHVDKSNPVSMFAPTFAVHGVAAWHLTADSDASNGKSAYLTLCAP